MFPVFAMFLCIVRNTEQIKSLKIHSLSKDANKKALTASAAQKVQENCGFVAEACLDTLGSALLYGRWSNPEWYPDFFKVTGTPLKEADRADFQFYFGCGCAAPGAQCDEMQIPCKFKDSKGAHRDWSACPEECHPNPLGRGVHASSAHRAHIALYETAQENLKVAQRELELAKQTLRKSHARARAVQRLYN